MSFSFLKKYTLEEICTKITDGSHKSPKSEIEGYPMASVKDMNYSGINLKSCRKISKEDYLDLVNSDCRPLKNDILIAKDGSYLKYVVVTKEEKELVLLSSIAILRPNINKIFPSYLKYYLLNPSITKSLEQGYVSGSVIRRIVLKDFKKFPVNIHKIDEQKSIANILSTLDEKIEINNKINKNLEEMAQAIFKHWFVDFEFPNEEGQPYKSSGGKLVDSELGIIPEGWEIKKIGDVLDTVLGGTPSRRKDEYWKNGNIPWINSGKTNEFRVIKPSEYITEIGLKKSSTKLLPKRSTLIAITGATLGQISLLEIDCCANQSVVAIKENDVLKAEYIYPWINFKIQEIINLQTGGAQQHINKNNINNSNILLPKKNILKDYYQNVSSLYNIITKNIKIINILSSLRDTLLPKLMSGEIRVPIAEEKIAQA